MQKPFWSEYLWGQKAKFSYLLIASILMLFTCLGGREIWTQEHRWADIVSAMFYAKDFLHPSLDGSEYYDKPLLSYWLIAFFALLFGKLSLLALRLPSALAGLLAIFSIYRLGSQLKNKSFGLMAGWLLLTTYFFVFWARTSSADMMNMAGTLFAVMWYFDKKNQPTFFNYAIFFLIMAVTALCKGLVGPVVTVLAILPDLLTQQNWKKHLRLIVVLSLIPAGILYVLPFWASSHFGAQGYGESGLYLVYRENILRYFQPFDHKGPIYTYFIFLPVYILPWALFFIPALFSLGSRFKKLDSASKWMIWSTLLLFVFFTVSGSRRSYYVLPLVPFAILLTADWIMTGKETLRARYVWAGRVAVIFFLGLFLNFAVVQPIYYSGGGLQDFATQLQARANSIKPWTSWQVVSLDAESKIRFYLQLPPNIKEYSIGGKERINQTGISLLIAFPILQHIPKNTIFITRKQYVPLLKNYLANFDVIMAKENGIRQWIKLNDANEPAAFVPN